MESADRIAELERQLQAAGQELEVYKTSYVTRTAYKAFEQLADKRGREVRLRAALKAAKYLVDWAASLNENIVQGSQSECGTTWLHHVTASTVMHARDLQPLIDFALATPAATPPAALKPFDAANAEKCESCGIEMSGCKFCPDCGHKVSLPPAQEHPDTAVDRVIKYFAELQNDGYDFDGNGWDKEPLRECILEIIATRTAPEAQR